MRINDNEEGTVDMDMLEENLKVINTRLLLSELYKTEDTVGFCSKLKTLKFISALTRCVAVVSDESCNKKISI